jgi:glycerol transport system substrate-binding protein
VQWSPTGTNVPDYPKLSKLWWENIGDAAAGAKTPQQAMDALCKAQEDVMARLESTGVQGDIGPKLNPEEPAQVWFDRPGAPKAKLANEDPKPETIDYDTLIKSWQK